MKMANIPFGVTDWDAVEVTEHPGAPGVAHWRTRQFDTIRVRLEWLIFGRGNRGFLSVDYFPFAFRGY